MTRTGKCSNLSGCLRAYRSEITSVTDGEFVCPECHQLLKPLEDGGGGSFKVMPLVFTLGGLVVLGLIALLVSSTAARLRKPASPAEAEITAPSTSVPLAAAVPITMRGQQVQEREISPAGPLASEAPGGKATPQAVTPDLDLAKEENRLVKSEVLKRIDLMPNISAENKDKLYVSVERARQMGRIIKIPFASGKTELSPADIEALRSEVQAPVLQRLMQDPTAVFVILGFADKKGDEKTNLRISQERADAVLRVLRDKCNVINVMHGVGMGGSTLFDGQGTEKNRVSEAWAVLP
jgi:outer membrane protein OmpA-like peptidoglycan-associated protein